MLSKKRVFSGAGIAMAVVVLYGLMGCLELAKDDEEPGATVDVTGTWTGSNSSTITVSGGCGGGQGSADTLHVTAILQQSGTSVTGIAIAEGDTLSITGGVINGTTFTFGLAVMEAGCPQQSIQFTCTAQSGSLSCTSLETHCDNCGTGGVTTHTQQQVFTFTKQ